MPEKDKQEQPDFKTVAGGTGDGPEVETERPGKSKPVVGLTAAGTGDGPELETERPGRTKPHLDVGLVAGGAADDSSSVETNRPKIKIRVDDPDLGAK
ncbi:MAG: hypothetical protein IH888_02390 [Planctomycetes bacterium]|nr:hypothetical protein [Planctomycetota bacterium]